MNSLTTPRRAAVLALLNFAVTATADLYVSRSSPSGPTGIFRFDETTGAFLNLSSAVGVGEPYFQGIEVARNGSVYAVDNTIGYIEAFRFTPTLNSSVIVGPPRPPRGTPLLWAQYGGLTLDGQNNVYLASAIWDVQADTVLSIGIYKLDGITGQLTGTTPFASTPGMLQPYDLHFGPNGHLFVSDHALGVLEFDGVTGSFLRVVVAPGPGVNLRATGIGFGPDGALFVANSNNGSVLRYDPATAVLSPFIPPGSGGLIRPADLDFGPDGNLYIADQERNTVLRYRGSDGAPLGEFTPQGTQLFGPADPQMRMVGPTFLSFPPIPEAPASGPAATLGVIASLLALRRRQPDAGPTQDPRATLNHRPPNSRCEVPAVGGTHRLAATRALGPILSS